MVAWLYAVLLSFRHAISGIAWALGTQRNLQIHLAATALVITFGLVAKLASWKWCCLGFSIAFVWMAELFNTAFEILCDRVTTEKDEHIRRVKDVAAGAVLITAICAAFIALMIFLTD